MFCVPILLLNQQQCWFLGYIPHSPPPPPSTWYFGGCLSNTSLLQYYQGYYHLVSLIDYILTFEGVLSLQLDGFSKYQ
uniref:Uncharacterized protein n=1 Tax=Nelumbo nucifera TaxID=4432 RepID=A0A822XRI7_NELNU|nr:TPA_asm: hypothetical protein HUJ06_024095 [Nelumbo nucifera]